MLQGHLTCSLETKGFQAEQRGLAVIGWEEKVGDEAKKEDDC